MTASAWWFLASIVGIVLLGAVLEHIQRRMLEAERRRDEKASHGRLMRELSRIEPIEPRRPR